MQVKIYTIPIFGGEPIAEEMNVFLRTKKILQMESRLISQPEGACWCFCIRFVDDLAIAGHEKVRVDYRQVLDEATFARFSRLRAVRKQLAQADGIPAYAIFTDEVLAALAKIEVLTPAAMQGVEGIGEKKMEKYGPHFLQKTVDEKV